MLLQNYWVKEIVYGSLIAYMVGVSATVTEEVQQYDTMTANVSAYCHCVKCCGKDDGITASGVKVQANRTIAMSKDFAFGTEVEIDGQVYVVEDRGGAIQSNKIDIYFETHQEALEFGRQEKEVKIFKEV